MVEGVHREGDGEGNVRVHRTGRGKDEGQRVKGRDGRGGEIGCYGVMV